MGYEELAATFLSNLLAAPYNTQQAQLSAQQQQALLAQALGGDEAAKIQAQQLVPNVSAFPGMDVPVLGSVLNGVGQVGHVLQVGMGNAPDAPRPPLDAYVKLSESARKKKAQDDYAAAIASGASPSERAAKLASLGEFSAAEKALNPNAGKPSLYGDLSQVYSDPAQRIDAYGRLQAGIAAGRAGATAGVADQERVKGAGRASTLLGIPGADSEYGGLVQQQAAELGVDPQFALAIMGAESLGNPAARSPKGAVGLMQVMPGTAQPYLRPGERLDDPQVNARVGVAHLKDLLDYYGGDKQLAAAAYNAGQRAVDTAKGIPNYPETQQYVQRVSRYYMGATQQPQGSPAPAGRTATLNDSGAVVTGGTVATGPGSSVQVKDPNAQAAVTRAEAKGRALGASDPEVVDQELEAETRKTEAKTLAELRVKARPALTSLRQLRAAVERVYSGTNLGEATLEGIKRAAESRGMAGPQGAERQKDLQRIEKIAARASQYIRAFGASAQITKEDMAQLLSGLPGALDTQEAALAKLDVLIEDLSNQSGLPGTGSTTTTTTTPGTTTTTGTDSQQLHRMLDALGVPP